MPRKVDAPEALPEEATPEITDVENQPDEIPQTDPDAESQQYENPPEHVSDPVEPSLHQTDIEDAAMPSEGSPDPVDNCEDSKLHQTDTDDSPSEPKNSKGPRIPGRKRVSKSQSNSEAGDSGGDTRVSNISPQTDAIPPKKSRRRASSNLPVVTIDETRTVETQSDKQQNDLLDLLESFKSKRILTGTIQGVERAEDDRNLSYAVLYRGSFKIIIPAEQLILPPDDFRDRSPGDVMHYLISKRLGAEVDYIVKGIDTNENMAAASRLEAMALKRREYYFKTDRDGNYQVYEGVHAEARVISVIRAGIFVDILGAETFISLRELSYQRWMDAMQHFQSGQRVLVKMLSVDRSDKTDVKVTASVKQADDNPYEQALRKFTIGNRYVGTVSLVDTNGVFVAMDGGIDCLCAYPKRGRPPRGARVTVRILGINHETNRIWGAITHMSMPR